MQSGGLMHTLSDTEDEANSPECLLPVKDPYTSDDEKSSDHGKEEPLSPRKKEQPLRFPKCASCTDFSAADVLFFYDLDYMKQPSCPLDLTDSSAEKILEVLFRFVYSNSDDEPFTKNELNMIELFQMCKQESYVLSWLTEYDTLDYKNCTAEQVDNMRIVFDKLKSKENRHAGEAKKVRFAMDFTETIMAVYNCKGLNVQDQAKVIFRILIHMLPTNCKLLRYTGEGSYDFKYLVSEDIASDNPPSSNSRIFLEGDRGCVVKTFPDSVYANGDTGIGKIAIQVYSSKDGSSESSSEEEVEIHEDNGSSTHFPKPKREKDVILRKEYRTAANRFLRQFVPNDCCDLHSMNKMLGQHILQLIALAFNFKLKIKETKQMVGIFMKNEYLYLSKLVINDEKLESYYPCVPFMQIEEKIGRIYLSNWRLDLTIAKHRHALFIFLIEFL